ncbi:hypothetical protein VKT23_017277 [Stygiomarasmius scandens]|uniref:Heterokaryon incompatibility domain-containing protein n=1 Tax=Marasmiellus scandens TaxID=2682957 RepID=A0ABR1ISG4_9AGAR
MHIGPSVDVDDSPSPSSSFSYAPLYISHRHLHTEESNVTVIQNPTSPALMAPINVCPRRFIDSDTLRLVEFSENDFIPPYAILSHKWIWGSEVRYDEFKRPYEETFLMPGYQKIKAACQQASRDGIRLVWLDTCCIDYGRPADIAINVISMYAYYQNAEVCYTYLADIVDGSTLGGSEWFRRGWTLQELLAPRTVVFFNRYWQRIGDKRQLQNDLHWITTIPPAVLSGESSIQDIDVLTRISWAKGRKTTREQDLAYSLQGLLGVSIQPDFQESYLCSFKRLGKALLDVRPELKERLGLNDELFSDDDQFSVFT